MCRLTQLVEEHPLAERLQRLLMLALHRSGRRADALEIYRRARSTSIAELGLEPGAHLQRLHYAVLADDLALVGAATSVAAFI